MLFTDYCPADFMFPSTIPLYGHELCGVYEYACTREECIMCVHVWSVCVSEGVGMCVYMCGLDVTMCGVSVCYCLWGECV